MVDVATEEEIERLLEEAYTGSMYIRMNKKYYAYSIRKAPSMNLNGTYSGKYK